MDEKEMDKLMKNWYDDDGNMTDESKDFMKETYALGCEFEIELTNLVNKYVKKVPPHIFGGIWDHTSQRIMLLHNSVGTVSKPPSDIFG